MVNQSSSATENVFQQMLKNIHEGDWSAGDAIPSERTLIEEFGVSRIAIREALCMLRGLGVLDTGHGRRTRVRQLDSSAFERFLPLMLSSGGQRTFDQVFEMRLAIESHSAALAARRRTTEQLDQLAILLDRFRTAMSTSDGDPTQTDLDFHLEIAHATGNPLFPILLDSLAWFVAFAQKESCRDDPARSRRAVAAHQAIYDAIEAGDPDWARAEMEAHLRFSMTRRIVEEQSDAEAHAAADGETEA